MQSFITIAIDPGGCTGYAIATVTPDTGKFHFEYSGQKTYEDYTELFGMYESLQPLYLAAESFEFRKGQQRHGIVLESRNILGVSQMWCQLRNSHFCLQSPSQGKAFNTDEKLRKVGVYQPGTPHANDASRHLLYWWFFGQGSKYRLNKKANKKTAI